MSTTVKAFDIKVGDLVTQIDGVKFPFAFVITKATPLIVGEKQVAHQVAAEHGWFGVLNNPKSVATLAVSGR